MKKENFVKVMQMLKAKEPKNIPVFVAHYRDEVRPDVLAIDAVMIDGYGICTGIVTPLKYRTITLGQLSVLCEEEFNDFMLLHDNRKLHPVQIASGLLGALPVLLIGYIDPENDNPKDAEAYFAMLKEQYEGKKGMVII